MIVRFSLPVLNASAFLTEQINFVACEEFFWEKLVEHVMSGLNFTIVKKIMVMFYVPFE